jgi:hypothetical protein
MHRLDVDRLGDILAQIARAKRSAHAPMESLRAVCSFVFSQQELRHDRRHLIFITPLRHPFELFPQPIVVEQLPIALLEQRL